MTTPRHFFIVGTPRSGTTLLQSMLSRARGARIPPETHFLGITWSRRRRLGDIATDASWRAAIANIRRRCESVHIPTDWDAFERSIAHQPRTYASLLRAWLDAVASETDPTPQAVGEKSPGHTPFVPELLAMGRDAVAIQIVRDPRDIAASQRRAWGNPPLWSALRWRRDQRALLRYRRLLAPDRFASVRYEDLVADPEPHLRRLCALLGLDFTDAMLEPHLRERPGFAPTETHKLRTLEPVTTARVGRHREVLPRRTVVAIDRVCRSTMRELGYHPTAVPEPLAAAAVAAAAPPALAHALRSRTPADRWARLAASSRRGQRSADHEA